MVNILCVIPSRIGSTRLPRKPLLPIQGKPMVQWVYENAAHCDFFTEVIVATDSTEIAAVITSVGGKVMMTDPHLPTGSERVAAVAEKIRDVDVVVNLQGDEPFITPTMLRQLVLPYLNNETPEMTTLAMSLDIHGEKYREVGAVKVITDLHGNAIYFSRSPIPYLRQQMVEKIPVYHHMGVYAFRKDFLMHYKTLSQTPLEKAESLEQLRVLEHGFKIRVCLTAEKSIEVNTPEEYAQAQLFPRPSSSTL